MEKYVKKFVEGYKKFIGSDVKVQKTHGVPGTTLNNSKLEEPKDIDNYRSFMGQLIWYTTKVGTEVQNAVR